MAYSHFPRPLIIHYYSYLRIGNPQNYVYCSHYCYIIVIVTLFKVRA